MALLHQLIRPEELAQLNASEIDQLSSRLDSEIVKLVQRQDVQQVLGKSIRGAASQLRKARRARAASGGEGADAPELNFQDDEDI